MHPLPQDVIEWIRTVFREVNESITQKLSNNPNFQEESFDQTWIDQLSRYSSPITLGSSWTVRIDTHYLGGMRHYGGWEIADIGVLIYFRQARKLVRSKVALLQSKRLYPTSNVVREEDRIDYEIGFGRLADPERLDESVALSSEYHFDDTCLYGALEAGSEQVKAIGEYQQKHKTPVYYQFYNPWSIPFVQTIPLSRFGRPDGDLELGTRIVPAAGLHDVLAEFAPGRKPNLAQLQPICRDNPYGWSLEHFMADLVLGCTEGSIFESLREDRMFRLFNRRSGPISAAIAISIETPE